MCRVICVTDECKYSLVRLVPIYFTSGMTRKRLVGAGLLALGATGLLSMPSEASAQTLIGPGTTVETFNMIGTDLPANWSVRTGASASALGTEVGYSGPTVNWSNTGGSFKNVASALSLASGATTTAQSDSTDRALGVRQTGSFGDPGAAFVFNISTLDVRVSDLRFSAQMLSVQTRSTTWSFEYGLGVTPSAFVNIGTYFDLGSFGATTVIASPFGTALDNRASVWLRVVALGDTMGTGTRDTFAIDDFSITAISMIPELGAFALLGGAVALGLAIPRRRR